MLKRGIEVIAGAALMVVALLAVVPAVAQAQEGQGGAAPASAVVKPGDTLWSISEERLGPSASPEQIAREVERIYALNRERIGPDPNLIFSGQELSLPAAGGSSSADEAANKGGARTAKGRPADGQQASLPNLPKVPTSAASAVPTIGSLPADAAQPAVSPVASFLHSVRSAVSSAVAAAGIIVEAKSGADERRLLGWGIIALTLLVGALMAWKLPMKRYSRQEKAVGGIYTGYLAGGYQASYTQKTLHPYGGDTLASVPTTSVSTVSEPEPATNGSKAQATAAQVGANHVVGLGGMAQKRRRQLTSRDAKKRRRSSSAAEAHSTEARRVLRGAVLRTRAAAREPRRKRPRQRGGAAADR
jgi:LysM repeat protein